MGDGRYFRLRLECVHGVQGESLGQVLGYNGCYDSGTCPRDYKARLNASGK